MANDMIRCPGHKRSNWWLLLAKRIEKVPEDWLPSPPNNTISTDVQFFHSSPNIWHSHSDHSILQYIWKIRLWSNISGDFSTFELCMLWFTNQNEKNFFTVTFADSILNHLWNKLEFVTTRQQWNFFSWFGKAHFFQLFSPVLQSVLKWLAFPVWVLKLTQNSKQLWDL